MTPNPEEVSFKRVTQGDGAAKKHYFVMCTLHENGGDFEKSILDLTVTSEQKCWQAQGLKKPKTPHAEALRRIHMALSPEQQSLIAFKVQLTEKGDTLQIICAWKDQGKQVFQRHQPFELARDEDEAATTQVFDALLAKCEFLQAASKHGSGKLVEFQAVADDSQKLVQTFVDMHEQREEEMYLKFAAVLNEKKKRIRELEKEITAHKQSSGPSHKGKSAGAFKEASPGGSAKTEEEEAGMETDYPDEVGEEDRTTNDEGLETDAEESDEGREASFQEQQGKPPKRRKH